MSPVILLDSGPLGLVTLRRGLAKGDSCNRWLKSKLHASRRLVDPEITDYEVRRELLRVGKSAGIARLDVLCGSLEYLPITTVAMRRAAELWAEARRAGRPTADRHALDADVILAAQAETMGVEDFVIATTNIAHLSRFVPAKLWTEID